MFFSPSSCRQARWTGRVVKLYLSVFEDVGCEVEGFLEFAVREEEVGFGEQDVRVFREVVVGGEGFDGGGEFVGARVFG